MNTNSMIQNFILITLLTISAITYGNQSLDSLKIYEMARKYDREKNYEKALEYYNLSADQGYYEALFRLGTFYKDGYLVQQNYPKAVKLFKSAAKNDNGETPSNYNLGQMYYEGLGVKKDYSKALEYFKKASIKYSAGYPEYKIANMYHNGIGVKKDYNESFKWYLKSARYLVPAKVQTGKMYLNGIGVKKNINEAIKWLEEAHISRNHEAEYLLGQIYYEGKEVEKDYFKSYKYLLSSARGNYTDSYALLDDLCNKHAWVCNAKV